MQIIKISTKIFRVLNSNQKEGWEGSLRVSRQMACLQRCWSQPHPRALRALPDKCCDTPRMDIASKPALCRCCWCERHAVPPSSSSVLFYHLSLHPRAFTCFFSPPYFLPHPTMGDKGKEQTAVWCSAAFWVKPQHVLINDLDEGINCTLGKFTENTNLTSVVTT